LFQLKGDGGIEIMFQWFKVQRKMKRMHETCKNNDKTNEPKPMVCISEDARIMHFKQLRCM